MDSVSRPIFPINPAPSQHAFTTTTPLHLPTNNVYNNGGNDQNSGTLDINNTDGDATNSNTEPLFVLQSQLESRAARLNKTVARDFFQSLSSTLPRSMF